MLNMRAFIFILLLSFSRYSTGELILNLPEGWEISGSVIYEKGRKIGELASKETWTYSSGFEFIQSFKDGFIDDPESVEFISSGREGNVFWVCRSGIFEGAQDESGIWYVRRFWVNGPILTLYSYESCEENIEAAIAIASTMYE